MLLNHLSSLTLLLGIGLITSSAFNAQAQQSGQLVEAVEIWGNRRISDKNILKRIKTRPGESFNQSQIQLDLQAILAMGFFDKIQTRVSVEEGARGGVVVIFEVAELPLIQGVSFEGLKGID